MTQTSQTSSIGRTRRNEDYGTFVERFPVLYEPGARQKKAAKIVAVLRDHFGEGLAKKTLLEVGSSTGIMTVEFARACEDIIAFDVDQVALRSGLEFWQESGRQGGAITYAAGDACQMPIAENSVDIIVCNQVYEHVDDHQGLMPEMYRVLRPGESAILVSGLAMC